MPSSKSAHDFNGNPVENIDWPNSSRPNATLIDYVPTVLGDWSGGVDPGSTNAAIDQVASRVKAIEDAGGNVTTLVAHTSAVTPGVAYSQVAALLWDNGTFGNAVTFELDVYVTHQGGRDLNARVVVLDGGGVTPGTVIGSGTATTTGLLKVSLTKPTADALLSIQYSRSGGGQSPDAETAALVIKG